MLELIVAVVFVLAALTAGVVAFFVTLAFWGTVVGTLAGMATFLLINQLRYARWARRTGAPILPSRRMFVLHLREAVAFAKLGWWLVWGQVGAWLRKTPEGRPVLAVHGYTQNGTNFEALRRALALRGRPTRTVFLGFAWPWRRVAGYAQPLVAALTRFRDAPDGVDLVAHSMGGLVLRYVLHRHPDLRACVRSVVTLGTPHGGTAVAAGFGWIPAANDLMHGSRWVSALPTLRELLPNARLTTVGSAADRIVYPVESTMQPDVDHVGFDDIGHVGLLVDPRAVEATLAGLA